MSWIKFSNVSVTNGNATVTINNSQSTASVVEGDALVVAGSDKIYEVLSKTATTIVLDTAFAGTTAASTQCTVIPIAADYRDATEEMRKATEILRNNFQAMDDWATQLGTVNMTGFDGTQYTVRTARQMDADAP